MKGTIHAMQVSATFVILILVLSALAMKCAEYAEGHRLEIVEYDPIIAAETKSDTPAPSQRSRVSSRLGKKIERMRAENVKLRDFIAKIKKRVPEESAWIDRNNIPPDARDCSWPTYLDFFFDAKDPDGNYLIERDDPRMGVRMLRYEWNDAQKGKQ